MHTPSSTVSVLDYSEFYAMRTLLREERGPVSKRGYETWNNFDKTIRNIMRDYGKSVGSKEGVDFYHGDDWFHELYNGFALMTTTALSIPLLQSLQTVVTQHHANAALGFSGDEDPMCGLEVLITPLAIFAAWYEQTEAECRDRIIETGVQIL